MTNSRKGRWSSLFTPYIMDDAAEKKVFYSLILCAFIESCILPAPTLPILLVLCNYKREKTIPYMGVATASSLIGGIVGYIIGYSLWPMVSAFFLKYLVSQATFYKSVNYFVAHQSKALFLASLLPGSYKVAAITSGFCKISLKNFIVLSIIGRLAHFSCIPIIKHCILKIWGYIVHHKFLCIVLGTFTIW